MRVVFFGNSEGVFSNRHFAALPAAACEIVAVVDVPPARRDQHEHGRSRHELRRASPGTRHPGLRAGQPEHPEFVAAMAALRPDLFLAVGYPNLLKAELLGVPRLLAANFHASLLPAYRGQHPLFWALRNGEKWVGLTVHVIDAGWTPGTSCTRCAWPCFQATPWPRFTTGSWTRACRWSGG